mmetsp:Transcript_58575/g.186739  ORF Transcript_58575/g.186739 Transcript_58575/m.186739 type:complete len:304 (+) Transcript_58575:303-1214(+)
MHQPGPRGRRGGQHAPGGGVAVRRHPRRGSAQPQRSQGLEYHLRGAARPGRAHRAGVRAVPRQRHALQRCGGREDHRVEVQSADVAVRPGGGPPGARGAGALEIEDAHEANPSTQTPGQLPPLPPPPMPPLNPGVRYFGGEAQGASVDPLQVQCLAVSPSSAEATSLISGGWDNSVRVWDLTSGQCTHVEENAHNSVVMNVMLYEQYILTGSLDGRVKIWGPAATGAGLELTFTHPDDEWAAAGNRGKTPDQEGVLCMEGTLDSAGKACLMVSYNPRGNDSMRVRVFEMPSFEDKGAIHGVRR